MRPIWKYFPSNFISNTKDESKNLLEYIDEVFFCWFPSSIFTIQQSNLKFIKKKFVFQSGVQLIIPSTKSSVYYFWQWPKTAQNHQYLCFLVWIGNLSTLIVNRQNSNRLNCDDSISVRNEILLFCWPWFLGSALPTLLPWIIRYCSELSSFVLNIWRHVKSTLLTKATSFFIISNNFAD